MTGVQRDAGEAASMNIGPRQAAEGRPPSSQGGGGFRRRMPVWIQEMPRFGRFRPNEPDPNYTLLDPDLLEEVLQGVPIAVRQEIYEDIDFLEYEVMRLFRERDHRAKVEQNRYRRQQLNFLMLSIVATLVGSVQLITLGSQPDIMPFFAFLETIIALFTAFLAALGGREPPQEQWMLNRRRAEQLRREYFRFLTHMPPYDEISGYQRRMLLAQRAAEINRGMQPEEATVVAD